MAPLETELATQQNQQNILQHNLDLLPDLFELKAQRKTLLSNLNEFLAELKLADTDSRISNFNDGYGQGEATLTALGEEEQRQLRKEMLSLQTTSRNRTTENRANGPLPNGSATKPNGLRPHQSIRKFLSDDL